jgi:curli biogenesis system outer membrane secretion channel CsgG
MLRSQTSRYSIFTLLAVLVAAWGRSAPAQTPQSKDTRPTVAVLYFDNGAVGHAADYEPLRKGMADMFITELMKNTNLHIVERDRLQALLEEQDLAQTKYIDKQMAVRIGKLLSAQHMIMGGFVVDPRGTMRIDARAVNVETSEYEHAETVSDQADNLLNQLPALARKFIGFVPPPSLPPLPPPAKSGDLRYLISYARAMDAQDNHEKDRAVALYKEFLKSAPPTLLVDQRKLAEERVARLQAAP